VSMISVCDGCGKQAPAACYGGNWHKPNSWFERTPLVDGRQQQTITACSRECIDTVEEKRKAAGEESNRVVLPI
jgi:hypothetical protein